MEKTAKRLPDTLFKSVPSGSAQVLIRERIGEMKSEIGDFRPSIIGTTLLTDERMDAFVSTWGKGRIPSDDDAAASVRDADDWPANLGFCARRFLVNTFSFPVVSAGLVNELALQMRGMRVADLGCGSGYLASALKAAGADVVGVDLAIGTYGQKVGVFLDRFVPMDGPAFVREHGDLFDGFILSWPPYERPFGAACLSAVRPGQTVFIQGESYGGCTGDRRMFDLLDSAFVPDDDASNRLTKVQVRWGSVHDGWSAYWRK